MQQLDNVTFKTVIASTPLISMDLIVYNANGQVLLGKRTNRPAKGFWFVPGGRMLKGETFEKSFLRLTQFELGQPVGLSEGTFVGLYEHHYEDCIFGDETSTHYVVLGYQLECDILLANLPKEQHQAYRWWEVSELLASDLVHSNTKAYFSEYYK